MTYTSLKEKHKSRIGRKDFKRNSRAKRTEHFANSLVFVSMLGSVALGFLIYKYNFFKFI
ncbi:MAG: hypothetical protein Ct9H300mP3_00750 [Gammaproteobacteria bacterium]|nr:MAG: hypothetical protein Ct9H300mP3_00750 [Gammaproteobacteria bacterium]